MKVSVDWLKEYVKVPSPFEKAADSLTMAGLEVEHVAKAENGDTLFEVEVTTNRPDWLSHIGVAREIAAVNNLALKLPPVITLKKRLPPSGWKVMLKEARGCSYYSGVLIEGLSEWKIPSFIKKRLEAVGLRSINLVVDITNYVLLETGQPLHAFDADRVEGGQIMIRKAKPKEKLVTIDESELELKADDLVIADKTKPIALAGVMGGRDTEVSETTKNVFLESAFFDPAWVRRMAKSYGLTSDSSYRFERRVDPEGVDYARERALELIYRYAKPRLISSVVKVGRKPTQVKKTVMISSDLIERLLGISIKKSQVTSILNRLQLKATPSGKGWKVIIPSYRSDLTRPVDLVEEIARIYGFENIPETLPERAPLEGQVNEFKRLQNWVRNYLIGAGLYETVTFSLISDKGLEDSDYIKSAVSIVNPQNKELCWMRPTLITSLLEVIKKNRHAGINSIKVFEIGNRYIEKAKGKQPLERKVLSLAITGHWMPKTWLDAERESSFFDAKGFIVAMLERLGVQEVSFRDSIHSLLKHESAAQDIYVKNESLGSVGQIKSKLQDDFDLETPVFVAELDLEGLMRHVNWIKPLQLIDRFPPIKRDLSVTVPVETKAADVITLITSRGQGLIRSVDIFDLFEGGRIPKGYKSLGFSVTYQSSEKTLVSDEIQALHQKIADEVAKSFQATFQ